MLESDPTARTVAEPGVAPLADSNPHALQILTTEHWSLLAARSLGYTEAMSRASIFIAALSGAVVALALVAQATDFGTGFVAFALVLLPVVFLLGLSTVARLAQVNSEDARLVGGMNRIRHAYLQLAPELEPYFVTSRYDDREGIMLTALGTTTLPRYQPFLGIPGIVAVIDAVVAAAAAGIAALALGAGVAGSIAAGAVVFALTLWLFVRWASSKIAAWGIVARFPAPQNGDGSRGF